MRYDPEVHHRRSIRLKGYDYASAGPYFVTVCTFQREMVLSVPQVAAAVQETWDDLPQRFQSLELDEFIVMPNHMHGILLLGQAGLDSQAGAPTLGRVMRAFKSLSAIAGNRILARSDRPFWQRGYYDRVIRDENELARAREYVRNNPLKWSDDPNNPGNLSIRS